MQGALGNIAKGFGAIQQGVMGGGGGQQKQQPPAAKAGATVRASSIWPSSLLRSSIQHPGRVGHRKRQALLSGRQSKAVWLPPLTSILCSARAVRRSRACSWQALNWLCLAIVQAADADWHPAPRQDEWGSARTPAAGPGAGKAAAEGQGLPGVPRQEKYNLEPYDSDDYDSGIQNSVPKDSRVRPAGRGPPATTAAAVAAAAAPAALLTGQSLLQSGRDNPSEIQRKLAELELSVDSAQARPPSCCSRVHCPSSASSLPAPARPLALACMHRAWCCSIVLPHVQQHITEGWQRALHWWECSLCQ